MIEGLNLLLVAGIALEIAFIDMKLNKIFLFGASQEGKL